MHSMYSECLLISNIMKFVCFSVKVNKNYICLENALYTKPLFPTNES